MQTDRPDARPHRSASPPLLSAPARGEAPDPGRPPRTRGATAGAAAAALALAATCAPGDAPSDAAPGRSLVPDLASYSWVPEEPRAGASEDFWDRWGDGRAEMSGYRVTVPRYGETRTGELVLVYVTEPHDRRRWIKDDDAVEPHRVEVMKLNAALTFRTGVYPYSVLTSVFAPVADWGRKRFSPVKLTSSVQEWCGSWRRHLWPGDESVRSLVLSYFAGEGERARQIDLPEDVLFEDALLVQLRELDGPFAGGGDWEGHVVPSLWRLRAGHADPEPRAATITRREAERDGTPVTRFVLEYGDYRRTWDVERAPPRRVLGWTTSDGAEAQLLASDRMAYWRMNAEGDESARTRLGLDRRAGVPPDATAPVTDAPPVRCGG